MFAIANPDMRSIDMGEWLARESHSVTEHGHVPNGIDFWGQQMFDSFRAWSYMNWSDRSGNSDPDLLSDGVSLWIEQSLSQFLDPGVFEADYGRYLDASRSARIDISLVNSTSEPSGARVTQFAWGAGFATYYFSDNVTLAVDPDEFRPDFGQFPWHGETAADGSYAGLGAYGGSAAIIMDDLPELIQSNVPGTFYVLFD